tara:strand:+ start:401 stop:4561 length:4161 start_codon:yes stop_codon:yes gene_type:complete
MRDQNINTFEKGMIKDAGHVMPQNGFYSHAENIRILADESVGESGIVVSVKGNKKIIELSYTVTANETYTVIDGTHSFSSEDVGTLPCAIIGYTIIRNTLVTFSVVKGTLVYDSTEGKISTDVDTNIIHAIDLNTYNERVVYTNKDLNFNINYPIQAIGRYESESIQRVYWTDNLNPVRTFNIETENADNLGIEDLSLSPLASFTSLKIKEVITGGSLKAGMYQYVYRLRSAEGAETRFSQPSNFIHVVSGSVYWKYNTDPENQIEYNGTIPGEDSGKKVIIHLEDLDVDYDYVEVVAIYRSTAEGITSSSIIGIKEIINGGAVEFTHAINSNDIPISLEEVTAFTTNITKASTIESKDNRLFLANLETRASGLTFDATSYRYKLTSDESLFPYKEVLTGAHVKTYTTDNNPYNEVDEWFQADNSLYKYQKDGRTLGGEGTYIDFKFTKKRITGTTRENSWEYPPYVEGKLGVSSCGEEVATGDYKEPTIAESFTGYQRDEVYRFGIVLYDLRGNPGFVNWIGDIRFPSIDDIDWEGIEDIYNWTLAQTEYSKSGASYGMIPEDATHNDLTDIENIEAGDLLSDGKHLSDAQASPAPGLSPVGDLFALGIEFKLKDLPEDLKPLVGGYSFVRVKRTNLDKATQGMGLLTNFLHHYAPYKGATDLNFRYGINRDLYYYMHNQTDNMSFGSPHHWLFHISSPEFDLTNNYPSSGYSNACTYVRPWGALYGRYSEGFTNDAESTGGTDGWDRSVVYGIHYTEYLHTILKEEDPTEKLIKTITYSSKHGRGEILAGDSFISEYNRGAALTSYSSSVMPSNFRGVQNIAWDATADGNDADLYLASVGEKCLLVQTDISEDPLIWFKYMQGNDTASEGGVGINYVQKHDKLLVSIRNKNVHESRYGGTNEVSRKNNIYISTGHFSTYSEDAPLGYEQVWGGDIYVTMYDISRTRKTSTDQGDLASNAPEGLSTTSRRSNHYAFPVESSINTTLRRGYHFANQPDFTLNTETPLNEFIVEGCYSSENDLYTYIPEPLGFLPTTSFPSRVAFSHTKSNGAIVDQWRKLSPYDYVDINGNNGGINSLNLFNDFMFYIQDTAVGILSINPVSTILDQSGSEIVLGAGKNVIQDFKDLNIYTGVHKFISAVVGKTGLFWIDRDSKILYKVSPKGVVPISEIKGLKSWFSTNIKKDSYITAGYDSLHNEVLFSVNDSHTIVYNEMLEAFTSIYTFNTPLFINLKNKLFSVTTDSSEIYEHGIGDYATWYENNDNVKLEFIVNKNPLYPKAFDSVMWSVNNSDGTYLDINNDFNIARFRVNSPNRMVTETISEYDEEGTLTPVSDEYSMREGISVLHVPRNDDERMRGTYMKVQLESTSRPEDKIALNYVKTLFRISKR